MPKTKDPENSEQRLLDKRDKRFCDFYVKYSDVYKAADRAGIAKCWAKRTFDRPEIQEEIARLEDRIEGERAKQLVAAERLDNTLLDRELLALIRDPRTPPSVKREAIQLGLVVTGRIQAGNTRALGADGTEPGTAQNFYRATVMMEQVAAPLMPEGAPDEPPPPPPGQAPRTATSAQSNLPSATDKPKRRVGGIVS